MYGEKGDIFWNFNYIICHVQATVRQISARATIPLGSTQIHFQFPPPCHKDGCVVAASLHGCKVPAKLHCPQSPQRCFVIGLSPDHSRYISHDPWRWLEQDSQSPCDGPQWNFYWRGWCEVGARQSSLPWFPTVAYPYGLDVHDCQHTTHTLQICVRSFCF